LYLLIGQFCALMAEASFDLAVWPAAIEQAHAASVYGEMIGYPSLQAWALGMQAITTYWRGRPREALKLVEAGIALAPAGSPRARLLSISARAWAHAGDGDRARTMLALADRDRDDIGEVGRDELHDVIGGQFAWGPARQAMSAASAYLTIGDAPQAAARAREAIRLQPQDQAGQSVGVLARADLAYAELAQDQADAAEATLAPVWELKPAQRRFGLVERLGNISDILTRPRFARSKPAAALVERIVVFTADAAPKALPPGSAPTALPGSE
jgi:tetratricopeptide (TPR) repeat protein